MDIAQIVDSAGNLPRNTLYKYNITEVPLYFSFNDDTYYRENVDCSNEDFYLRMQENPQQAPKTCAVNTYDWLQCFNELYEKGHKSLIVTTIAGKLSATYQNAIKAREMFLAAVNNARVEIIDTQTCACGQAALEIRIAQMIHELNLSWAELLDRAQAMIPNTTSLFSVRELTYMKAGGRIGGAAAFLGNIMKIQPICEFIQGSVHPIKAVRSRPRALKSMVDICAGRIANVKNTIVVTQNALCEDDELLIVELIKNKLGPELQIFRSRVGTSVGAHSGPGAIGIGLVSE